MFKPGQVIRVMVGFYQYCLGEIIALKGVTTYLVIVGGRMLTYEQAELSGPQ